MAKAEGTLRICPNGHRYYKKSDCLTCPVCENERKPQSGFLSNLSAPARRALEREGIDTVVKLSGYTEKEILKMHGIGKTTIPILKETLQKVGLSFKNG